MALRCHLAYFLGQIEGEKKKERGKGESKPGAGLKEEILELHIKKKKNQLINFTKNFRSK